MKTAPGAAWVTSRERIHDAHRAVLSVVTELLGNQLFEPVVVGVRPQVRVEPRELVRRRTPNRRANELLGGIEHGELEQYVLRGLERDGKPILVGKDRRPTAVLISLRDYQERFADRVAEEEIDASPGATPVTPPSPSSSAAP